MNLTKEQLKRAVLGGILVLIAIYAYFSQLLAPLSQRENRANVAITKLTPLLREANAKIKQAKSSAENDPNLAAAQTVRDAIENNIPREAVIVWLPQRVGDLFRSHGIATINLAARGETPDPDLAGFVRSQWAAHIPETSFPEFAHALSVFENQNGLAQVTRLNLSTSISKAEQQNASFTFQTVNRP